MECDVRREATLPPGTGALIIDLAAFRRPRMISKPQPKPVRMEFGGGGYHEAAIRAEQARPRDA